MKKSIKFERRNRFFLRNLRSFWDSLDKAAPIKELFIGIHTFSGKRDSVLLYVYVLDADLDNVTGLKEIGGMLYKSIRHLGDVKQAIVMHADINEATEVNNVTYGALELHTLGKVANIKNLA